MLRTTMDVLRERLGRLRGEGLRATFAQGALASFLVHCLGMALAFVVQLALARVLGAEQFGAFALAATWLNVLVVLASLGLDSAALRFLPAHAARGEREHVASFTWASLLIVLASSFVIAGATALVLDHLGDRLSPAVAATFLATLALVPARSVLLQATACLQEMTRVVAAKALPLLVIPLALLLLTLAVSLSRPDWLSAASTTGIHLGVTVLVMTWAVRLAIRPHDAEVARASVPLPLLRDWLGAALPLLAIATLQLLLTQVDKLMVGAYLGAEPAGLYVAASQVASAVAFGITAVNVLLAPTISDLHAAGRRADLQRILTFASRGVLVYSIPVMLVLVGWGHEVLALFDPSFRRGHVVVIVLGLSQLAIALSGSVGFLLTMTGNQRAATCVIGASVGVDVALNAVLIPWLGLEGAALATLAATLARNAGLSWLVRRRLGVSPTAFGRRRP